MGVDAQMLVRTRTPLTKKEVRRLSVDLCEAFSPEVFTVWEANSIYAGNKERHALSIVKKYEQDGDTIYPEAGETFIAVNLRGRFYGEGYERGPIHDHIAVAGWLEVRIPDARVFYGGDSSGICAEPFDAKARKKIFKHFATVGHRPYRSGFGSIFGDTRNPVLCAFCDTSMMSTGGGRDRTFWYCVGCGKKVIAKRNGETVIVPPGKDFFDIKDAAPVVEQPVAQGEA